jgi:two-component system cell cycle sensor histidine kinase/response regulator CckA
VLIDVSTKRTLEEQAARATAVGRLAAGVAHDINNLQAVIVSSAQMLARLEASHPALSEGLDEIVDAARQAATLAHQLVVCSRPESAGTEGVDLNRLIAGRERLLKSLLGSALYLELELDPSLGPISAEACEMEQILLNLVANAKDAMQKGGAVRISTARVSPAEVGIRPHASKARSSYVRLRVADTGPGIAPEILLRIFEPCFSTKRSSGLGLSTVEGIVRRLGGHIQVHSLPEQGTVVDVLFPERDQPPPHEASSRSDEVCPDLMLSANQSPPSAASAVQGRELTLQAAPEPGVSTHGG